MSLLSSYQILNLFFTLCIQLYFINLIKLYSLLLQKPTIIKEDFLTAKVYANDQFNAYH
jgi:hypothetical protein